MGPLEIDQLAPIDPMVPAKLLSDHQVLDEH